MKNYCGTDIIEVDRVKSAILSTPSIKEKVFSVEEISYAEGKSDNIKFQHYAGRFAAKEAIYKSISNIDNSINFCEIEIVNDINNKNRPVVNILKRGKLKSLIDNGNLEIDVSISHIKDYAVANSSVTLF